jgi:hypothetical protein
MKALTICQPLGLARNAKSPRRRIDPKWLVGEVFGLQQVIDIAPPDARGCAVVQVRCQCGDVRNIRASLLTQKTNAPSSCRGCAAKIRNGKLPYLPADRPGNREKALIAVKSSRCAAIVAAGMGCSVESLQAFARRTGWAGKAEWAG